MIRKIKRIGSALLAFTLVITSSSGVLASNTKSTSNDRTYTLKYSKPAAETYHGWEREALPIGNGAIGNKLFGLIGKERIQFNEKTLWSGGPMPDSKDYNGGNYTDRYKYIPEIRKSLENGDLKTAKRLAESKLVGPNNSQYGKYLNFGDILIDFTNQQKENSSTKDYQRVLDISSAIHRVTYSQDDTKFTRESFVSKPNNVAVTRLSKEGPKNMDLNLELKLNNDTADHRSWNYSGQSNDKTVNTKVEENGLLLTGKVKDNDMNFASYVLVDTDGTKEVQDQKLVIKNATYVNLIQSAKTDYALDHNTNYRDKDIDVEKYVIETAKKASGKSYDKLKDDHISDYKNLFDRVKLNVSEQDNRDTDVLLREYKSAKGNYLEELFFQYGRYLLISSSRDDKNALPANLQGVWNAIDNPPWNSDYHMNVNLQMNYWPAYSTNLAETALPLIDFVDDLRYYGRVAANEYAGIHSAEGEENGWLAHTQVTPFGWTTPGWNYYWGWSPAANAWIMQNVYDYYRYTNDIEYLRNKIYPMLKETAKFWNSFLHYDEASDRYVSSPSYSPEHGPITIGNTFDQSLIYQLFTDFIEASEKLGVDQGLAKEVKEKQDKLKPLHVNNDGMVKEWYEEDSKGFNPNAQPRHRHISHLVGLFPGSLFDTDNEEMIQAARATLNDRGDEGTGWSKANKINLWARLLDGNRAHKLLSEQLINSTYDNLWDTHPPYQIDGNLGATSGIAEMLVQSHLGRVQLLPAIPDAWNKGSVEGIMARGNFEVKMDWENKLLKNAEIKSNKGGELVIEYPNIATAEIKVNGKEIADKEQINSNQVKLNTNTGDIVTVSSVKAVVTDISASRLTKNEAEIKFNPVEAASSYIIQRESKQKDGSWGNLERFTTNEATFLDDKIEADQEYRYKVITVYGDIESDPSREAVIGKYSPLIDDRDPRISYGSAYATWDDPLLYNGTQMDGDLRNVSGDKVQAGTASFNFYGTGIKIYGIKSHALGQAKVFIDGQEMTDLNFFVPGETEKSVLIGSFTGLELKEHEIKIQVVENPKEGIPKITLDYFKILDDESENENPLYDDVLPNSNQYKYQKDELAAFVHFGPNTFNEVEWGEHYGTKHPREIFTLDKDFDAEKLVKTIHDAGFKKIIITAKHHDGFAIWPSEYTDYDIASTDYKGGKGDVLKEISQEASKYDIDMGLYLSPWDIHEKSYGYYDENGRPTSKEKDVLDYNDFYNNQLEEILGNKDYGNKGRFVEVWMDGAKGSGANAQDYDFERFFDTIQRLQGKEAGYDSDVMLFGAEAYTTVRWIGNENGYAHKNTWSKSIVNYEKNTIDSNKDGAYYKGHENGNQWTVPESDARITSGWFWGTKKNTPKTIEELATMYFNSVGHNSPLLLNIPPNNQGSLDDAIRERTLEFGQNIRDTFKNNLLLQEGTKITASDTRENTSTQNLLDKNDETIWATNDDTNSATLTIKLPEETRFDVVSIEEAILYGQKINNYKVEYKNGDGAWTLIDEGITIGAKRLIRTEVIKATDLRISVSTQRGKVPILSEIGIYKASKGFELPSVLPNGMDYIDVRDIYKEGENDKGFTFKGLWHDETGTQYQNGTNTWANIGARFEVKFKGSKVYLVGTKDPNHGIMEVQIDDGEIITIDTQANPRTTNTIIFESDDLEDKEHTLKVRVRSKAIGVEGAMVINNNELGMASLEKDAYTMEEDSEIEVKIKRVGGSKGELKVRLEPNPGTAIQDDFDTEAITDVVFADGQTEATAKVKTRRNTKITGDQWFTINLKPITENAIVGFIETAKVTITDKDPVEEAPVNKEDLEEKISSVESELEELRESKTEESMANLEDALTKAKEVLEKEDLKQEEIDQALENLNKAYDALEDNKDPEETEEEPEVPGETDKEEPEVPGETDKEEPETPEETDKEVETPEETDKEVETPDETEKEVETPKETEKEVETPKETDKEVETPKETEEDLTQPGIPGHPGQPGEPETPEETKEDKIRIEVTDITDKEKDLFGLHKDLEAKVKERYKDYQYKIFDIKALNSRGEEVSNLDEKELVKVNLKDLNLSKDDKLSLWTIHEGELIEVTDFEIKDGKVEFMWDRFSKFAFVKEVKKDEKPVVDKTSQEQSPQTPTKPSKGPKTNDAGIAMMSVMLITSVGAYVFSSRKKKNQ